MAIFKVQNNLVVSVCIITYNHEYYIREAIESVLMQKTEFNLELVIGEDCSTDITKTICEDYSLKNPDKIRLLSTEKNLGMMPNFIRTLKSCSGKYIAICEGDDYWTDPFKLQKQIDFLEGHPEFSLSFHAVKDLDMDTGKTGFLKHKCKNGFRTFTTKEAILIGGAFLTTNSMVFRSEFIRNIPEWFINSPTGDFALSLILSTHGKVAYFDDVMSVYRRGVPGSWTNRIKSKSSMRELHNNTVKMLLSFNKYTSNKYFIPVMQKILKNRVKLVLYYIHYTVNKIKIS